MTIRPGRRRRRRVASLVAAALVAVALGACGEEADAAGPPEELPEQRGRFATSCAPSHHAPDDPIVYPGEPGASHLHEFFGNVAVDAHSTAASVGDADTTCETKADRASYWVPALLDDGRERIPPEGADVYYRAGRGVDPTTVEPYPYGLRMIAGEARSLRPQPTGIVGWSCSDNPVRSDTPPDCAGDLRLRVTFQDCWNGEDLDSDDHRSHVAYSSEDGCPDSHPVAMPQLEMVVRYPHSGDADGLRLASGDPVTAHGDFWNLWDPERLEREVDACIHNDVVCATPRT